MELASVTFIFGSILLSVGMFGGGIQLKELSIPKVGRISRFIATMLGVFFILIGFGLQSTDATSSTSLPSSAGEPVESYPGYIPRPLGRKSSVRFDVRIPRCLRRGASFCNP